MTDLMAPVPNNHLNLNPTDSVRTAKSTPTVGLDLAVIMVRALTSTSAKEFVESHQTEHVQPEARALTVCASKTETHNAPPTTNVPVLPPFV